MLHAVTYNIEPICGPGGFVHHSRSEVIDFAKSMAEVALDVVCDAVFLDEWFDPNDEGLDPWKLLQADDIDVVDKTIVMTGEILKTSGYGYIDLWQYEDIFQLIEEQEVESWCSASLRMEIVATRKAYFRLIHRLGEEWPAF